MIHADPDVITDTHVFFYGVSIGLIFGLPLIAWIYGTIIK